mmetsp:Transcript_32804/g.79743  ORF Transcript_32804/g.79743 Transcript_32804/m.79743 type:complete len:203 (-) Transcript_32804:218-826(-)
MTNYETIPTEMQDSEIEHHLSSDRNSTRHIYVKIGLLVLGAAAVLSVGLTFFAHPSNTTSSTGNNLPHIALEGMAKPDTARSCTFDECFASNCDWKIAPFTCLFHNGGPHGGCSAAPWYESTCSDQCDLTGCSELDIPDEQDGCDIPCDDDWCANGQRLCGPDVPYQCTSGSSTFGCAADEYMWTLRVESTSCSSCCNVKTC